MSYDPGKPEIFSRVLCYNEVMKKYPLGLYVVCVVIALALVNYIAWSVGGEAKLKSFALLSGGFLLGMLAMYIAVHLYRWK